MNIELSALFVEYEINSNEGTQADQLNPWDWVHLLQDYQNRGHKPQITVVDGDLYLFDYLGFYY